MLQRYEQDAERKEQDAPVDQLTAADRPDGARMHESNDLVIW
jgi:hypothetical protein